MQERWKIYSVTAPSTLTSLNLWVQRRNFFEVQGSDDAACLEAR